MDTTAIRGLGVLAERDKEIRLALNYYERFVLNDPLNLATPEIKRRIGLLKEQVRNLPPERPQAIAAPTGSEEDSESDQFMGDFNAQPLIASKRNYGWLHEEPQEQTVHTGTAALKSSNDGWLGGGSDSMDWYDVYADK